MGAVFFLFFPFFAAISILFLITIITYLILKFVLYIFNSFGLLNIARSEKYKFPYIAWIPCIGEYITGKFVLNKILGYVCAGFSLLKLVSMYFMITTDITPVFYICLAIIVAYFIFEMLIMNMFYKKVYKHSQIFTLFTIITFGILKPIFIYTSRFQNKSRHI